MNQLGQLPEIRPIYVRFVMTQCSVFLRHKSNHLKTPLMHLMGKVDKFVYFLYVPTSLLLQRNALSVSSSSYFTPASTFAFDQFMSISLCVSLLHKRAVTLYFKKYLCLSLNFNKWVCCTNLHTSNHLFITPVFTFVSPDFFSPSSAPLVPSDPLLLSSESESDPEP